MCHAILSFKSVEEKNAKSYDCWYFQTQLLFGGSVMEAGAWCQKGFLSIKLKLVEWTELTVLAFHPIYIRVLVFLLHSVIETGSSSFGR